MVNTGEGGDLELMPSSGEGSCGLSDDMKKKEMSDIILYLPKCQMTLIQEDTPNKMSAKENRIYPNLR